MMLTEENIQELKASYAELDNDAFFGTDEHIGIYDICVAERNKRLQARANSKLSTMRKKGGVDAK